MPPRPDLQHIKLVLEAALLSTQESLSLADMRKMLDGEIAPEVLRKVIDELRMEWNSRSVELIATASGWRCRVKLDYQRYLDRLNPEKAPRYSRAVMETLAIIAYKQPVTRGDIEAIRGVAVSTQLIKTLESRGWIDVVGHREVPGRPALLGTTKQFLDDLGLRSLQELPALAELGNLVIQELLPHD